MGMCTQSVYFLGNIALLIPIRNYMAHWIWKLKVTECYRYIYNFFLLQLQCWCLVNLNNLKKCILLQINLLCCIVLGHCKSESNLKSQRLFISYGCYAGLGKKAVPPRHKLLSWQTRQLYIVVELAGGRSEINRASVYS